MGAALTRSGNVRAPRPFSKPDMVGMSRGDHVGFNSHVGRLPAPASLLLTPYGDCSGRVWGRLRKSAGRARRCQEKCRDKRPQMAGEGRKRLKNGGEDRRGRWSLKRDVSPDDDRDGSWRASCRGGTDERLPQPDAWEKLPGLAGGEQGAHDEGRAANRTGMGFPPGVRDLLRLWGGELDLVEGQTAPGFGQ